MLQQVARQLPRLWAAASPVLGSAQQGLLTQAAGASSGHLYSQLRAISNGLTGDHVQRLLRDFSAPPHSLQHVRPSPIPSDVQNSMLGKFALKMLMFNDKWNQLIVGGQELYEAIKEQVDDKALHRAMGLDPNVFYSTYTLLAVHVWLIVHRLGASKDREQKFFKQRFYNRFMDDVEKRIYDHGVQVGVKKWQRKLESVFYDSGLSFDKVISKQSSETLDDVVLRVFFGGDATKRVQSQLLAAYLRHELACLQLTDENAIMKGQIQFSRKPFEAYRQASQIQAK